MAEQQEGTPTESGWFQFPDGHWEFVGRLLPDGSVSYEYVPPPPEATPHSMSELRGESDLMSRGVQIHNPLSRTVRVIISKTDVDNEKSEVILPGKAVFIPLRRGQRNIDFFIVKYDEMGNEIRLGKAGCKVLSSTVPAEVLPEPDAEDKPFPSLAEMMEKLDKQEAISK